jgi:hypothetical protein
MAINKHIRPETEAGARAGTGPAKRQAIPRPKITLPQQPATRPKITLPKTPTPRPKITLPKPTTTRPKITLPTRPAPQPTPPVRPAPTPPVRVTPLPPPPQPRPAPPVSVPEAPSDNPFMTLPAPTAGSRIKSEDFRQLSQCLQIIFDAYALSNALLGQSFGEAKQLLAGQHYTIERVMSVFGVEITHLDDPALDERQIIQIVPAELGEHSVTIIVTEAVETRRLTPNIVGFSYSEAGERLRAALGDVSFSSTPMSTPQLVGLTLAEARHILST